MLVSAKRAAKHLGISPRRLNYLTKCGRVDVVRTEGGHFRYDLDSLMIKNQGKKIIPMTVFKMQTVIWKHIKTCQCCHCLFRPKTILNSTYCSRECAERHVVEKTCKECDAVYEGSPTALYCSQRCSDAVHSSRRRALKLNGERISLAVVARKDNNKCHICWRNVDMSLSGADERGPTIDHVFPLSLGGSHTYDNTKLAHRRCNSLKRDRIMITT